SAVPQKFRLGNAARKSVMKALMSSRPLRGSCSEYFSNMSGAAISSTTRRLQASPQKSVNQRPTIALLSSCKLMGVLLDCCLTGHRTDPMTFACVRLTIGFESKDRSVKSPRQRHHCSRCYIIEDERR